MAYDQQLAGRIRELFADIPVREKSMFGGRAFLVADRIAVAASSRGGLLVRTGVQRTEELLETTVAQPMTMKNRVMRGWVHIDGEHLRSQRRLAEWVEIGIGAAASALGEKP